MDGSEIATARRSCGLAQAELARLVGTSRETLSAYEHNRKSPTLDTLTKIAEGLGCDVRLEPRIRFTTVVVSRGRPVSVPTSLPRLPAERALATVTLPLHLDWSPAPRAYDLADRRQRARLYEIVLREATPEDILAFIDGVLLVDLWPDLVLPREIRQAWSSLVDPTRSAA